MSSDATPPPTGRPWAWLLLVVPAPSIGTLCAFHLVPGPVGNAIYGVGKGILYGAPLLWWWLQQPPRPRPSKPKAEGMGVAIASGLGIGAVILAAYALLPDGAYDPALLRNAAAESGFDTEARFLAVAAWLCVVNALLEEYVFRWFLYGRCRELLAKTPALLAGAAIFTAHHVIVLRAFFDWPLTLLASAGVFIGGLVWTWTYERYQSIWPGYVSHALVDVAIMVVGWDLLFG